MKHNLRLSIDGFIVVTTTFTCTGSRCGLSCYTLVLHMYMCSTERM